jgi:hypothetical protein
MEHAHMLCKFTTQTFGVLLICQHLIVAWKYKKIVSFNSKAEMRSIVAKFRLVRVNICKQNLQLLIKK